MCGVIGYIPGPDPRESRTQKLFAALVRESSVRGLHAFGAAWRGDYWPNKLDVVRSVKTDDILLKFRYHDSIIAHNRYALSGDWKEMENNQPITLEDQELALVFNGVIDMGTREEMEARWGVKLRSYNDGEIFLRLYEHNGRSAHWAQEWVRTMGGSFAGLWMDETGAVSALRNERRPLWVAGELEHPGEVWLASTRDILDRAGVPGYRAELEPNRVYTWVVPS